MKPIKGKGAIDLLIRGIIGGGCGLFASYITVVALAVFFFGGETVSSCPPIEWLFDHPYFFFIWYGTLTIIGFIWGVTTKRF